MRSLMVRKIRISSLSLTCHSQSAVRRFFATAILLSLAACSLPPAKVKVPSPPPVGSGAVQIGIASWYGPGFHGKPTASGVIYDQNGMTAAHQTLPLGTRVMVTNLDNGKSIEVTVNDRGPFAKGRVLDLSYAAAQALEMIKPGTSPVRIEVIDSGSRKVKTIPQRLDYTLQVGSFIDLENAQQLREQLVKDYPQIPQVAIIPLQNDDGIYYRVQLGTFSDRGEAEAHARQLARRGLPIVIMEK